MSRRDSILSGVAACLGFALIVFVLHLVRGAEPHPDRQPICYACGR